MKETSQVLLVDYGGVLGNHHLDEAEVELAKLLGVDRKSCCELIGEHSDQGVAFREDRITETEFWDRVMKSAHGHTKPRPSDALLSRLWAETYSLDPDVLSILKSARTRGRTGVLTNIDRARSAYLEQEVGILDFVDIYIPSYRCGAIKPKNALWERATQLVQRQFGGATEVVYVDDRLEHVEACVRFGWKGIVYRGLESLRSDLTSCGILVNTHIKSGDAEP